MDAHARDLGAVLAAVVPDGERAVVVAHSLGGGILLAHVDAAGDDRIDGAVLAGSGGSAVTVIGLPGRRLPPWARARVRATWATVLRAGARLGRRIQPVRSVSDRVIRRSAFAPGEPAARRAGPGQPPRQPPGGTGGDHAGQREPRRSATGPGTRRVPTLLVHGSADPEVPDDEVRELMARLPDGELVTVPGAGHMLPLTHPEVVAEQATRWVARVAGRPGRRAC